MNFDWVWLGISKSYLSINAILKAYSKEIDRFRAYFCMIDSMIFRSLPSLCQKYRGSWIRLIFQKRFWTLASVSNIPALWLVLRLLNSYWTKNRKITGETTLDWSFQNGLQAYWARLLLYKHVYMNSNNKLCYYLQQLFWTFLDASYETSKTI